MQVVVKLSSNRLQTGSWSKNSSLQTTVGVNVGGDRECVLSHLVARDLRHCSANESTVLWAQAVLVNRI